jgi:hypothetical protein
MLLSIRIGIWMRKFGTPLTIQQPPLPHSINKPVETFSTISLSLYNMLITAASLLAKSEPPPN